MFEKIRRGTRCRLMSSVCSSNSNKTILYNGIHLSCERSIFSQLEESCRNVKQKGSSTIDPKHVSNEEFKPLHRLRLQYQAGHPTFERNRHDRKTETTLGGVVKEFAKHGRSVEWVAKERSVLAIHEGRSIYLDVFAKAATRGQ